jgi:hypothetical protein
MLIFWLGVRLAQYLGTFKRRQALGRGLNLKLTVLLLYLITFNAESPIWGERGNRFVGLIVILKAANRLGVA